MKLRFSLSFVAGLLFMCAQSVVGQEHTIWQLGNSDGSSSEFALSPNGYKKFLEHDFGYEDNAFIIGQSSLTRDLPYVLPGPANEWGGTGGTSGLRTHFLNLYYVLNNSIKNGQCTLQVKLANSDPKNKPTLQIVINGKPYNFEVEGGAGNGEPLENPLKSGNSTINIPLPADLIKKGGNQITMTVIKGGWVEFDSFKLLGPQQVKLIANRSVIVKNVQQAEFEILNAGKPVQNMLVDLLKLKDDEQLKVVLDGKKIYEKTLEKGAAKLEIPMPYVAKDIWSKYEIYSNGQLIQSSTIKRGPKRLGGVSDYVNTMMGAAHSRWMIAPGPWMPFGMVKISPDNQNIGWQAGYEPSIESIGTFSHIHEWTMAGLGTFPTAGQLKTRVGDQYSKNSGYRSAIDKTSEKAPLGYYAVHLLDHDIDVKLTAGTRSSFQQYTYH
ncbi:polysaccharide lyase family protein, partial [Sphingobacterium multivorum]